MASIQNEKEQDSVVIDLLNERSKSNTVLRKLVNEFGISRYIWKFILNQLELLREKENRPSFAVYELIINMYRMVCFAKKSMKDSIKFTDKSVSDIVGKVNRIKYDFTSELAKVIREKQIYQDLQTIATHVSELFDIVNQVGKSLLGLDLSNGKDLAKRVETATDSLLAVFDNTSKEKLMPVLHIYAMLEEVSSMLLCVSDKFRSLLLRDFMLNCFHLLLKTKSFCHL